MDDELDPNDAEYGDRSYDRGWQVFRDSGDIPDGADDLLDSGPDDNEIERWQGDRDDFGE